MTQVSSTSVGGHTLFTQLLAAQLPVEFWGTSVIDQLKHLEDAGYIKVAFSPPRGTALPGATVNEITHLGRAVARYFGTDPVFSGGRMAFCLGRQALPTEYQPYATPTSRSGFRALGQEDDRRTGNAMDR